MIASAQDIFDGLGKLREIGDRLGVTGQAISNMKQRNDIPPRYWPALIDLAREKGKQVTTDALMQLSVKRATKQ